MTNLGRRGNPHRVIALACFAAIALALALRAGEVGYSTFNEDEVDGLYHAWRLSQGEVMFRDWWDARGPLSFAVNRLLLPFLPEPPGMVVGARIAYQILIAGAAAFLALLWRRARGDGAALLGVAVFLSFSFVTERTAQARPDDLALFFIAAAFWAVAGEIGPYALRRAALAGAMLALAGLSKQVGWFAAGGVAVFLGVAGSEPVPGAARQRVLALAAFGGGFAFACVVALLLMFGRHLEFAVSMFTELPVLRRSEDLRAAGGPALREALVNAPLWIAGLIPVLAAALAVGRAPGERHDRYLVFTAIQIVFALAYLLVRGATFEQDLIYPALCAACGSVALYDGLAARTPRRPRAARLAGIALVAMLAAPSLVSTGLRAAADVGAIGLQEQRFAMFLDGFDFTAPRLEQADKLAGFLRSSGPLWSYPKRTQAQQRAATDWLLERTGTDDAVLTDDNLPIVRRQAHRGPRTETWSSLLALGAARGTRVCDVEPVFCAGGLSDAEKILRVLDEREVRIISLGGLTGEWLLGNAAMRRGIAERYRFEYLPEALFWAAIREDQK